MTNEIKSTALFHVLSLEDCEKDFEIICEKLIDAGYKLDISRVDTESEFINLVQNITYDIILADYNLSGFDAFEALNICKKYCPDVPFICVSGSIGEITAIELLKNGAVDYVLKDRLERLPFAVNRALKEAGYKKEKKQVEQTLQYSEEKYRAIFENVQDVFYQTDLSGIIREISPSIKYFSDFDVSELMGKPVSGIYSNPKEREMFFQILSKNGEVRDYEIKLITKFGEIKYGSINARLVSNQEGVPDHIDGSIRDITLRKLAEELLQQSEQRLHDIIFSTEDWVWEVDEMGRFTYRSQRDIDLFDVANGEIIGKTPFDFMPEDKAKRIAEIFFELASQKAPIKDLENWYIGKGGKKICLLSNGVPILDSEGQLKGYRGIDKDITQRKLAEEALKQNEYELNLAQEIARMGSWNLDLRTYKQTWSKNMYLILGLTPYEKEVNLDDFLNLVHPDDKYLIDFHRQEIITTKAGVSFEFRFLMPDDKIIWIQNIIVPVFLNDELVELEGVNIDITEKKRTEQELILAKEKAEASDRLKSSFINNISHEIRTPLNGILGFINILINMDLSPEEKDDYLAMLNSSSDRLVNTVTSFLDISLLASGNQKVYKKELEVESFLDETIGKYRNACKEKNLTLSVQIPSIESDFKLITDVSLVRKIMNHLMDNSIKFTNQGGISIGYEIGGNDLHFFVKDTGVGIHRDNWQQIFGYFMQENSATNRGYEGSGLGLPIANGFVELLGGKIWLDSEKGKGTTFFFSLPCEEKQPVENKQQINHQGFSADGDKQTILVVEDDNSNFVFISALLKRASISVLHAEDGFDAILCVQNHPEIKLVLMDLKLPEMDGFDATQQIKLLRNDLPVIAVTAYSGTEEKQKALEAGCDDIITKPLKKELLFQKIEQFGIRIT